MGPAQRIIKLVFTKETCLYLFFGVVTTGINLAAFYLFNEQFAFTWASSTVIAWITGVFFAFVTNKIFVFHSYQKEITFLVREFISFLFARLFSLGVEIVGMWLMIDLGKVYPFTAKVILGIVVVVVNYLLSKIVVFGKEKEC
ncbi:GtrA family protein [Enterococcus sp. AZ192]|uniref:GtrA family protein n=1 Tax=unclassified Enterococcus TaxID=2608891 RepID=UPI003D2A8960